MVALGGKLAGRGGRTGDDDDSGSKHTGGTRQARPGLGQSRAQSQANARQWSWPHHNALKEWCHHHHHTTHASTTTTELRATSNISIGTLHCGHHRVHTHNIVKAYRC